MSKFSSVIADIRRSTAVSMSSECSVASSTWHGLPGTSCWAEFSTRARAMVSTTTGPRSSVGEDVAVDVSALQQRKSGTRTLLFKLKSRKSSMSDGRSTIGSVGPCILRYALQTWHGAKT